jgi:MYXO-CTERM domain-containing protein
MGWMYTMNGSSQASRWLGLAALSLTAAVATRARAEPVCSTPDEFNAAVAADDLVATIGTLTFTIQGLALAGVEKHHLVVMTDGRTSNATGGSCVGIDFKTWGDVALPQDLGTVKEELFNTCCVAADCEQCFEDRDGANACETWAGPRPSDVVFTGPDQTCDVTISVTPETFGYDVQCTPGVGFGFEEANRYQLAITEVQIPVTDVATITNASFCYEAITDPGDSGGGGSETTQIPVMEDVTASPAYPDAVYPTPTDLALSTGDGEIYLKFSLEDVPGAITSATLYLHAASDPSANGDGGDVFVVTDDAWSEATLTWSSRPATSGAAVGRVEGIEPDTWVSVDVGSAISAPDVYSFAIVPRRTDANGAHFDSKEVGPAVAAYLEITYDASLDPGDGGASESGGSDEAGGSEGADESAGGTASGGDGSTSGFVSGAGALDDGAQVGCGCRSQQRSPAPAMLLLLALGLVRRRGSPRPRPR